MITLPAGNWNVYIDSDTAGTTALRSVSDEISVEPISALVLIKEPTRVAVEGDHEEATVVPAGATHKVTKGIIAGLLVLGAGVAAFLGLRGGKKK